jgi:hypothetical protein
MTDIYILMITPVEQRKQFSQNFLWIHCSTDKQALAAKNMPEGLKQVVDNKVKSEVPFRYGQQIQKHYTYVANKWAM